MPKFLGGREDNAEEGKRNSSSGYKVFVTEAFQVTRTALRKSIKIVWSKRRPRIERRDRNPVYTELLTKFELYTLKVLELPQFERIAVAEELTAHLNIIEESLGPFYKIAPDTADELSDRITKMAAGCPPHSTDRVAMIVLLHACTLMKENARRKDDRKMIKNLIDKVLYTKA